MKIKFKLIDEKSIKIIAVEENREQEVGCIFTPASSGQNITNAIQVCGCSEIYDFWGCARYIQPKELDTKKRVIDALDNKKEEFKQAKDIQIMFNFETEPSNTRIDFDKDCLGCFNKPCTCENRGNHNHISPYNVKREEDLQYKLKYLDDGKIHLKPNEREKLLRKLRNKRGRFKK